MSDKVRSIAAFLRRELADGAQPSVELRRRWERETGMTDLGGQYFARAKRLVGASSRFDKEHGCFVMEIRG